MSIMNRMANGAETRREKLVTQAIDPMSGKLHDVTLSIVKVRAAARTSEGKLRESANTVPIVLQSPTAVFEGLRRDDDEPLGTSYGWRCYCGVPDVAYTKNGDEREPWPGEVFLVFVNEEWVVYNWYWYKSSEGDPDLPADHEQRFRERLL